MLSPRACSNFLLRFLILSPILGAQTNAMQLLRDGLRSSNISVVEELNITIGDIEYLLIPCSVVSVAPTGWVIAGGITLANIGMTQDFLGFPVSDEVVLTVVYLVQPGRRSNPVRSA